MENEWILLLAVLVGVGYSISLSVLSIDLIGRQCRSLVQVVDEVELPLQGEVEEPLVPHLNQGGLAERSHHRDYEILVLLVEVFGEPYGQFEIFLR